MTRESYGFLIVRPDAGTYETPSFATATPAETAMVVFTTRAAAERWQPWRAYAVIGIWSGVEVDATAVEDESGVSLADDTLRRGLSHPQAGAGSGTTDEQPG